MTTTIDQRQLARGQPCAGGRVSHRDPAVGVHRIRQRPRRHFFAGRHRDDSPGRAGRTGDRRDLPRYRISLRRDVGHPRRCGGCAQRQPDKPHSRSHPGRAGRHLGQGSVRHEPGPLLRMRKTQPRSRADRLFSVGQRGPARRLSRPRQDADRVLGFPSRVDQDLADREWSDAEVADYIEQNSLMVNPLLDDGYYPSAVLPAQHVQ